MGTNCIWGSGKVQVGTPFLVQVGRSDPVEVAGGLDHWAELSVLSRHLDSSRDSGQRPDCWSGFGSHRQVWGARLHFGMDEYAQEDIQRVRRETGPGQAQVVPTVGISSCSLSCRKLEARGLSGARAVQTEGRKVCGQGGTQDQRRLYLPRMGASSA